MSLFLVKFDATGFLPHGDLDCALLSPEFIDGFNETMNSEKEFPANVISLHAAGASPDDDQEDEEEMKFFVTIELNVEADSEEAAWNFAPPADLLTKITDSIPEIDGSSLDGEWEVLEVSESEQLAPKKKSPKGP